MKTYRPTQKERMERVSREAAEWQRVMRDAPNADDSKGFMDWVQSSPMHLRELLVLRALEDELDAPGVMERFDLDAVTAAARGEDNVVSLHDATRDHHRRANGGLTRHRRDRRRMRIWTRVAGVVAVLLVGCTGLLLMLTSFDPGQSYATALGEQRQLTLADGTVVTMAPSSRISVDFSPHERNVTLHAGEAWFDVVHNAARPFTVYAGASVIQDVGTQFAVNRLPSGTVVTVSEGEVEVTVNRVAALDDGIGTWLESWMPADRELIRQRGVPVTTIEHEDKIVAGQTAHITRNGRALTLTRMGHSEVNAGAQARKLVFHDSTLADIAAEFNRYNARQIVVEGEAARRQRYSGVIKANDAASFLQFLTCCSRLQLVKDGNRTVVRFPTRARAGWH